MTAETPAASETETSAAVGPSDDDPPVVVRRLTTFPVKSLDGRARESVRVVENGGLAGDREFALFDADGEYVNGKRERAIHRIRSRFDPNARTLDLSVGGTDDALDDGAFDVDDDAFDDCGTFDVDDEADRAELTDAISAYFGYEVSLRQNRAGGFPDDASASGPTVISTATIRAVASWFDGVDPGEMRRRLRANVELGTPDDAEPLPPFWEDRLFDRPGRVVEFDIGDVRLAGVNPCQRCVVPSRDPDTGEEDDGFRETFLRRRRETMPAWSGGEWFDHDYRLMVNTRVAPSSWGETLAVGDAVSVGASHPADDWESGVCN